MDDLEKIHSYVLKAWSIATRCSTNKEISSSSIYKIIAIKLKDTLEICEILEELKKKNDSN